MPACVMVHWYTTVDGPIGMAAMPWPFMPGLCHPHHSLSLPIRPPLLLPYTGNKLRIVRLRRLSKSCLGCNNPEILALDKHRTLLDILDRFLFMQAGKEHDFLLIVAHSVLQLFVFVLFWVSWSTSTTDVFQRASCCREVWYRCCPSQTHVRPSHVLLISIPLSFFLWSLTHKIVIHSVWPLTSECPPVLETLQGVLHWETMLLPQWHHSANVMWHFYSWVVMRMCMVFDRFIFMSCEIYSCIQILITCRLLYMRAATACLHSSLMNTFQHVQNLTILCMSWSCHGPVIV